MTRYMTLAGGRRVALRPMTVTQTRRMLAERRCLCGHAFGEHAHGGIDPHDQPCMAASRTVRATLCACPYPRQ